MQFKPGAFSRMGISNGIPPNENSSGRVVEGEQGRTLPTPSTEIELEDLLRERERRVREREGGTYDFGPDDQVCSPGCISEGGAHHQAMRRHRVMCPREH